MTRDARLPALHRGGFRLPGPRFRLGLPASAFRFGEHPDRLQRAPGSQVVVPGGRGPYLPGRRLRAAAAGRHTSLPFRMSPETPLKERGCESSTTDAYCSQHKIQFVDGKKIAAKTLSSSWPGL